MSQTFQRNFETDSYKTLISNSNNDAETEKSIVQALVQASLDASGNTYTCPANNTTWDYSDLSSSYINTSAIFNYPAGTVTKNSVISVDLSNNDLSFNTYSTNISSVSCGNNTYTFSSLPTSTPYYDCNYVVTQSIIRTAYDASSNVSFSFDLSNSNVKVQNAAQSRWNTTTAFNPNVLDTSGSDPLTVTQDVSFNTLSAFGQQGTVQNDISGSLYESNWATINPADGSVIFNPIDISYQPASKNIFVTDRTFIQGEDLSYNTDIGIFRLQQGVPQITTDLNGTPITGNDLLNIPMFDAGTALSEQSVKTATSTDYYIPGNMTSLQFNTLVSPNVRNTIQDGWNYSIDISSNGGGYTIDTPNGVLGQIDDSDIKDNLYYMENYVDKQHKINIVNGSVTVAQTQLGVAAGSINVDSTNGETLNSSNAGTNGEIIIDNRSIATRTSTLGQYSNNIDSIRNVYYDDASNTTYLDANACTSDKFNVFWKKVTQSTSSPEVPFVSNNNAVLNLYTDKLVDASYNNTDFDLSFNSTLDASLSEINIWKINLDNNLVAAPNSFYSDASYATLVDTIKAFVHIPLLGDASYNFPHNEYRLKFNAKKIEDLSIFTDASNIDCELFYDDSADTFLKPSNVQAFEPTAAWPNLIDGQPITDISYSVSYGTVLQSLTSGGTLDSVTVSYTDSSGVSLGLTIPQSEIKRTGISSSVTYTDVSAADYTLTTASLGRKLVRKEIIKVFTAEFYLKMRPYTNVKARIDNIIQTTTMYVLQNSDGTHEPRSILQEKVTSDQLPDLYNVIETVERVKGLSFSGFLTRSDFDHSDVVLQYNDSQGDWGDLTDPVGVNVFYGQSIFLNLSTSGTMAALFNYEMNDTDVFVTTLQQENYYIPLTIDGNATHSLCSFQTDVSDIATKTSLSSGTLAANRTYLTVTDNYAAANASAFDYSKYNLSIQKISTGYTLTVSDGINILFTINSSNNSLFFGDIIVSRNKFDMYYAQKELDTGLTESYETVDYASKLPLPGIDGIYITQPGGADYDATTYPSIGSNQTFRVLGDKASVSLVGSAGTPVQLQGISTLSYTGTSTETTVIITLPFFRGYYQSRTYIINRTASRATFNVDNVLFDSLTTNMYANEQYTVNDLRNPMGQQVANLNIKGTFIYSIMPDNKPTDYIVTVTGDPLTVTIVNPNYSGSIITVGVSSEATPVNSSGNIYTSSLKDYGKNQVYTFSGDNWYLTDSFMKIRPSRVKLTNASYLLGNLLYNIGFETNDLNLYLSPGNNWLGNPALLGSQDPNLDPSAANWVFQKGYSLSELNTGINIGGKTLSQPRDLSSEVRILYFVSAPPYYKYQQMSTENCLNIPYDFSMNQATTRYHPYTGLTDSYNPFTDDLSFNDVNSNVITVVNDEEFLNNVTFTFEQNIPTLLDLKQSPTSVPISANVKGTNIKIELHEGVYPSTDVGSHTNPVYEGPITEIPSTPDITKNGVLFQSRDPSGGINFGLLQYPSDVGLSNNAAAYTELLRTPYQNDWYNINMNMGNASWFNDNSGVTYFDMHGTGVEATLYTVLDANDPTTQTNFRRVFKYYSHLRVNINSDPSSNIETATIPFISREYYDQPISGGSFTNSLSGVWNYQDLLENTDISGSQISWTPDISFNENSYVGWSFGNSETSKKIIHELLYLNEDSRKKWTFITLENFMTYKNQFGLEVASIAWDGSTTTPLINTRTISLSPAIQNPVLNISDTTTIEQYSSSSLSSSTISQN